MFRILAARLHFAKEGTRDDDFEPISLLAVVGVAKSHRRSSLLDRGDAVESRDGVGKRIDNPLAEVAANVRRRIHILGVPSANGYDAHEHERSSFFRPFPRELPPLGGT